MFYRIKKKNTKKENKENVLLPPSGPSHYYFRAFLCRLFFTKWLSRYICCCLAFLAFFILKNVIYVGFSVNQILSSGRRYTADMLHPSTSAAEKLEAGWVWEEAGNSRNILEQTE